MNDPLHSTNFSTSHRGQVMMASTALWPSLTEKTAKHKLTKGMLISGNSIPAFCNPLVIFIANWVLMLVTLSVQVTYVSYPSAGIPALLLTLSLGSFLLGYLVSRMLLHRWPGAFWIAGVHAGRDGAMAVEPDVLRGVADDHHFQLGAFRSTSRDWRSDFLSDLRTIQAGPVSPAGHGDGECHPGSVAMAESSVHDVRYRGYDHLHYPRAHHGVTSADVFRVRSENPNEQAETILRPGWLPRVRPRGDYADRKRTHGAGRFSRVSANSAQIF